MLKENWYYGIRKNNGKKKTDKKQINKQMKSRMRKAGYKEEKKTFEL